MDETQLQFEREAQHLETTDDTNCEAWTEFLQRFFTSPQTFQTNFRLHRLAVALINQTGKLLKPLYEPGSTINRHRDEMCTMLLRNLLLLVEKLPTELVDTRRKLEEPKEHRPLIEIIELDQFHGEPIGLDLLFLLLRFQDLQDAPLDQTRSITEQLTEILCKKLDLVELNNTLSRCIVYYLEEIRGRLLPLFRSFRDRLTSEEFIMNVPSFLDRFCEAKLLRRILFILEIQDNVVESLLPCVLFVVDDFDSRIALIGVECLHLVLTQASVDTIIKWKPILTKTIADRLLSADNILWQNLVVSAVLFSESVPSGYLAQVLFEKMLKRVSTDLDPFELVEVFLESTKPLVRRLGLATLRFFSELIPLMTQWILYSRDEIQIRALSFMNIVVQSTQPRISRHVEILSRVLEALEEQSKYGSVELKSSIQQAKKCLVQSQAESTV